MFISCTSMAGNMTHSSPGASDHVNSCPNGQMVNAEVGKEEAPAPGEAIASEINFALQWTFQCT